MADIAMETGDVDYHSAVRSLWDNIVNKKYYVTGGVGSGETSEGFGKNYSLPNHAYCESCAGCGELFFQHKMNLIHHDAQYADLYEETLYNAILGGVDLEGKNFTYTNSLDSGGARYPWHGVPVLRGQHPADAAAAADVDVLQERGQPVRQPVRRQHGDGRRTSPAPTCKWSRRPTIRGAARCRSRSIPRPRRALPSRSACRIGASANCTPARPTPTASPRFRSTAQPITPAMEKGYAVIARTWKAGDRIESCAADATSSGSRPATRSPPTSAGSPCAYGPLIYNIESVDQNVDLVLAPDSALSTQWKPDLLGGVTVVKGTLSNGAPLIAIPNYARHNRGGRSVVWVKDQ